MLLRLGTIVLSSALLGLPRALGDRVPRVDRSGYVEVAAPDLDPRELAELIDALLSSEALAVARQPAHVTLIVEVLAFARAGSDPDQGALLAQLGEGAQGRPLVVERPARRRPPAARPVPGPGPTLH